jgi:hypothetical protein
MATATRTSRVAVQLARRARNVHVSDSVDQADMTSATLIVAPEEHTPAPQPDRRPTYTCPECEHVLRTSGLGRHRVYFELHDDRAREPVMNRACPACGHGLPGKNPTGSRS